MQVWRAFFGVTAALLMVVCALSGCGDSSPAGNGVQNDTPAQILAHAKAAVAGAATVHVNGSIVAAGTPISLDMDLISGKGGEGTLALDGYNVRLIEADGGAYLNGSSSFFRHAVGSEAAKLGGHWLKAPVHRADFSFVGSLTSLAGLTDAALAAHSGALVTKAGTVDGQPAVVVSDRTGGGSVAIATTGNPYPLELHTSSGGHLTFSGWNQPAEVGPPAGAVNISHLQPHR